MDEVMRIWQWLTQRLVGQKTTAGSRRGSEWFISVDGMTHGPYSQHHMASLAASGGLQATAYIRREDWQSWVSFGDYQQRMVTNKVEEIPATTRPSRGLAASRAARLDLGQHAAKAVVYMHDHHELTRTKPVNISLTGLLVETSRATFEAGNRVKLTVKIPGPLKPFNIPARVARRSQGELLPYAYGLEFDKDSEAYLQFARMMVNSAPSSRRSQHSTHH